MGRYGIFRDRFGSLWVAMRILGIGLDRLRIFRHHVDRHSSFLGFYRIGLDRYGS